MRVASPARTRLSRPQVRDRRTLEDRLVLGLRRSGIASVLLAGVFRLSPRNPIRKRVLARAYERTLEALNRDDLELFVCHIADDGEYVPPRRGGAPAWAGVEDVYRGPAAVERFHREWKDEWGAMDHEPVELIDLGDLTVLYARMRTTGRASGVELTQDYAAVTRYRGGWAERVEFFLDWDEAVAAAERSIA